MCSGFLMTRKKRPAVRDRYYDTETKIENHVKPFFLPVPKTMLQIHQISFSKSRVRVGGPSY